MNAVLRTHLQAPMGSTVQRIKARVLWFAAGVRGGPASRPWTARLTRRVEHVSCVAHAESTGDASQKGEVLIARRTIRPMLARARTSFPTVNRPFPRRAEWSLFPIGARVVSGEHG
jgi:hypothetical protein